MLPAHSAARTELFMVHECENATTTAAAKPVRATVAEPRANMRRLVGPAVRAYQAWYLAADQPRERQRRNGSGREQGDLGHSLLRPSTLPTLTGRASAVPGRRQWR